MSRSQAIVFRSGLAGRFQLKGDWQAALCDASEAQLKRNASKARAVE
jgi:hypothetical protein